MASESIAHSAVGLIACSRRLVSGEQVKSYAASTNFFPRQFFAGVLIFCPLPTIRTPGTGYRPHRLLNMLTQSPFGLEEKLLNIRSLPDHKDDAGNVTLKINSIGFRKKQKQQQQICTCTPLNFC